MIEIESFGNGTLAPLYHRYPSQNQAQSAYLMIDPTSAGRAWVEWNGEIGNAVPIALWAGILKRVSIPNNVSARALTSWIESDETRALVQAVIDGRDSEHDGSNFVGCYVGETDQERLESQAIVDDALKELELQAALLDLVSVLDVADYVLDYIDDVAEGVTASSTDDDLERIAAAIVGTAAEDHEIILEGDMVKLLKEARGQLREKASEGDDAE